MTESETPHSERQKPLARSTKALFGIGTVANGIVNQSLTSLIMIYYNQVIGLPPATVGLALMISLIADAFWDPAIGVWSDRTRSPLGRRHPFMYAAILPSGIAFFLVWSPPVGMGHDFLFFYLLITLMLVRLFVSLYEIPSTSLAPEMAPDYDERTNLFSYRYFFGVSGGILMSILAFQIFLSEANGGIMNPSGFSAYGLVAGIIITASIGLSTIGTHSRIPRELTYEQSMPGILSILQDVFQSLKNPNFLAIMVSAMFSGMAAGLSGGLGMYFNIYFWELKAEQISILILAGVASAILGVFLAPFVSQRWGKKRAMLTLFSLAVFVSTVPMTLRLVGILPGNDWPLLIYVLAFDSFAAGTLSLMGMIIVTSMLSDVVEDNAARTGKRSEGLFFAANSILQKSVTGVGTFVSGLLLQWVSFPEAATPGSVDDGILRLMASVYLPTTVVLCILSIACLLFFKINKDQHQQNLRAIS